MGLRKTSADKRHGTAIRIGDDPTDVTLDNGDTLTVLKGKGRFRIVILTPKPIRSKRRRKQTR